MSLPSEREEVVRLFRLHGVAGEIRQALDTGEDERVYVITSEQAATVDEAGLTRALMELLHRKVWVTTWLRTSPRWPEGTEPL